MKRNKRSGSALVMVLLFSLLFIVFSSISVLAVVTTFKSNEAENYSQTLYYESEGGLEEAKARANRGDFDNLSDSSKIGKFDYVEDSTNDHVFVKVEYTTETSRISSSTTPKVYLQVESIAVKNGISTDDPYNTTKAKRTSRVKLAKSGDNMLAQDIFKYAFCGESIKMSSAGAMNSQASVINSANGPVQTDVGGSVVKSEEFNRGFTLPIFDDTKIPKVNGVAEVDFTKMSQNNYKYYPFIRMVKVSPPTQFPFYVCMINADKVKIIGHGELTNTMILTNGEVRIDLSNGDLTKRLQMNMVKSSIVGKNVITDTGDIHVSYTPLGNEEVNNPHYSVLHSPLKAEDVEYLFNSEDEDNKGITYYAPNFKHGESGSTGGSGGSSGGGKYTAFDYN